MKIKLPPILYQGNTQHNTKIIDEHMKNGRRWSNVQRREDIVRCIYVPDNSVNFVNEIKQHEDYMYGNDVHRLCGNDYVSSAPVRARGVKSRMCTSVSPA